MAAHTHLMVALVVSLAGHAGVLATVTWTQGARPAQPAPEPIRVTLMTASAKPGVVVHAREQTEPRPARRRRAPRKGPTRSLAPTETLAPPAAEARPSDAEPFTEPLTVATPDDALEAPTATGATAVFAATAAPGAVGADTASQLGDGAGDAGECDAGSGAASPRYRVNPPPEYPLASRRRREQGLVLLRVDVSAAGRPSDVTVHRSSGAPALDAAAVAAVGAWEFDAARRHGVAIASRVIVPVRFSLDR